jgi:MMP 1-O-methyltransferase
MRSMTDEQLAAVGKVQGWLSDEEAVYLFELARDVESGCIVEVGSFRGRSTAALCLGAEAGHNAPVYAIEPHEHYIGFYGGSFGGVDRTAFFQAMLDVGVTPTVRLVNLSSEVVTPGWTMPVSLLWIDGDHRYEGVRRDIDCWAPHLARGATVVFDDVNDPKIGPVRVVDELVAAGWRRGRDVGKTATLYAPEAGLAKVP